MKANTRHSAGVCLVLLMAVGSVHGTEVVVEGNRPVARIVIIPEPATSILLLGSLAFPRMGRRTNATARHATTEAVR